MSKISAHLNFKNNAEEAFNFYKSVFKTEFVGQLMRWGDMPVGPDQKPVPDSDKNLLMHVALPILGGFTLMGGDNPDSTGIPFVPGNNFRLSIEPDSKEEADQLFAALSAGGKITMPMQMMFWGDYYGDFTDKFGINWMINCSIKK